MKKAVQRVRWAVAKAWTATRSFLRLPPADQGALILLVPVVATVEVLLRSRPLPSVTRLLGVTFTEDVVDELDAVPLVLTARERRRVRCVRRIVRHWPFCAGTCLRESLVIGHLLQRHRPRLVVGVNREADGALVAHAWLDIQGHIIGEPGLFQRLA